MPFETNFGKVREIGRTMILPLDKIKQLVKEKIFDGSDIESVIDFGAGTLIWSKWLKMFISKVIAVDTIFDSYSLTETTSIICTNNIQSAIRCLSGHSMLWVCDVIHHLPPKEWNTVKDELFGLCDYIVIKDIDANYKFGNFMNRLHDRIINGEKINDVNPKQLMDELRQRNYKVYYRDIHKLWYPHFLIIAEKK